MTGRAASRTLRTVGMARSELAQRLGVAAVGIPLTLGLIYMGRWVFGVALALVAAGAAMELYRMATVIRVRPLAVPGAVAAVGFVLIAAAKPSVAGAAPWLWALLVTLLLVAAGAAVWTRGVEGRPLEAVSITLFGALLPGATLAFALFLRHLALDGAAGLDASAPNPWAGTSLVVYAIGLTWINDSCAYFAGRTWGRRKLIPSVSPGKTVVGGVAGVVGAIVVGGAYTAIVLDGILGLSLGAVLGGLGGGLIAVVAQIGDLVESVIKREVGVKDSGQLIPGHGGVLDRFDALFFTLPVAYAYLWLTLSLANGVSPWPWG